MDSLDLDSLDLESKYWQHFGYLATRADKMLREAVQQILMIEGSDRG